MKNLFILSEEEKNRILNLHESATKRHYLTEQFDYQGLFSNSKDPLNLTQNSTIRQGENGDPYQYMKWGNKFWYAKKSEGKNPKWVEAKNPKAIENIKTNIFKTQPVVSPNKEKVSTKKNVNTEKLKKKIGQFSTRTQEQLKAIQSKEQLKNESFIIVNKAAATASLFGPNYKFIANSSITTGEVKDSGVDSNVDTSDKNWMVISLDYAKKNPKTKDGVKINDWLNKNKGKIGLINSDGSVNWPIYLTMAGIKTVDIFPFSYEARKKSGKNITPSGMFGISTGENEPHYAGGENDTKNAFALIDPNSIGTITPALHGYASPERGGYIKQASKLGLNVDKDFTRAGSGCVNLTPDFLEKMRQANPSWVIILPDTGGVVDVKVTTLNNFKVKLTQAGAKCYSSISALFS
jgi:hypothetical protein